MDQDKLDIVDRLLTITGWCREAAAEIQRLRQALEAAAAEIDQLRAERSFDAIGMTLMHAGGRCSLPDIPGKPHKWAAEISAWAAGGLVQWRYASQEAAEADWRDCDHPSRGEPNWWHAALEFSLAPPN